MDDLFLLFEHIRSNNIELITDANQQLTEFIRQPENIELLLLILQNHEIEDLFFLQQISILLKNIIRNNREYDFNQYIPAIFEIIQFQTNKTVQETLISSLSLIESTTTGKGFLNEILNNALSEGEYTEQTSRYIQILAESNEIIDGNLINEYLSLVNIGIENGFYYYSLLLGYKIIEDDYDDEEFVNFLYNTTFLFIQQNANKEINQVINILDNLLIIFDKCYPIEYFPLIQYFIEYIQQNEGSKLSPIFCNVMSYSINCSISNGVEFSTEDELNIYLACLDLSVQKYLELSNDFATINDIDFFTCVFYFSQTNPEFITEMFKFISQLDENKDYIASFILSFTCSFQSITKEFLEEIHESILQLLLNSLISPKRLVVESSVYSFRVLFEYQPFIFNSEILESFSTNIIQSLTKFSLSNDYLDCFQSFFKGFKLDDDLIFKYFECFSSNINENDLYNTSFILQCISPLLLNSKSFVQSHYPEIYELLTQNFLMEGNDYLKPYLFQCFASLSIQAPNLFLPNSQSIIEYLAQYILNDDNEISNQSLKSISKILSNCSSGIDPSLIIEEITQILSIEETNQYTYALSLSVLVYIANLYKDHNSELLPLIESTFETIFSRINSENSENLLLVARSLINYAQLCEQYESIPSNVIEIAKIFLEQDIYSVTIAEVFSAFVPLIQTSNHDLIAEILNTFLPLFFNNDLPNGQGIDTDESTLHSIISFIIRISIQELDTESFSFFSQLMEVLIQQLETDSLAIKEFILEICGQLFEMHAPDEYLEILPTIINASIESISNLSQKCCYTLQQICIGNPQSLIDFSQQIMEISISLIQENLEKSPFYDNLLGLLITLSLNSIIEIPEELKTIIINYGLPEFNDYQKETFESFYESCKNTPNLST